MDSHELQFFGPAILFLAVGMIAILAARRLRLSPIVGFLAAGVAVAPVAHQFFGESEDVMLVAELGVIFLMFDIGLNFSVGRLWQSRKQIFGLAPLQMAAAALIFGGAAAALGFAPKAAVLIGGGMALTSTAVVIQVLREAHQEASPLGRGAVAVLLAEDIVAVVLLILAATLADDTASLAPALGLAAVKAVCVIALVAVAGRFVLKPVFAWLTKSQDEEVFTAAALLVVLVTALFTGLGGLSMPLGAFLAGMIMAETEYCYMVKAEIRPFRGLLLGFFFIAVGMSLDLSVIFANAPIVIAIAAAQMAGKGLAGAFAAKATGVPRGPTVRYAFLMANGGEFALALFSLAAAQAVIGAEAATIVIAAIVCTLVAAPALAGLGGRLAERIDPAPTAPAPAVPAKQTARPGRVVIAGAGEPGIAAARCLHEAGADYLLLENDGKRFAAGRAEGLSISYGAPFDVKLLDQVGAGGAKAIVFGLTAEEA
ncbi:MAG: cation:proton antiporter, partial [Pseudomonadota bacterium]